MPLLCNPKYDYTFLMKRIFSLVLITTSLLLHSCKHNDNDPKAVSKAFVDAILKKDFTEAGKYATKESQSAMEMLKSAENMYKQFGKQDQFDIAKELRGKKIDFTEPKIEDGKRATLTVLADGQEKIPLILVKEGEDWKVAFDKATIMDTERKK